MPQPLFPDSTSSWKRVYIVTAISSIVPRRYFQNTNLLMKEHRQRKSSHYQISSLPASILTLFHYLFIFRKAFHCSSTEVSYNQWPPSQPNPRLYRPCRRYRHRLIVSQELDFRRGSYCHGVRSDTKSSIHLTLPGLVI